MRIVTLGFIRAYVKKNPNAETALADWYHRVKKASWSSFVDIKKDFNSVDYVGNDRYVFNIKGNHYRLVAIIIFASQKLYIRFIGTHKAYDSIDSKNA